MSDTTILILFLFIMIAIAALFFWALCRASAKSWEESERFWSEDQED